MVRKLVGVWCFQIGVNIIGLPEYLEIQKEIIVYSKGNHERKEDSVKYITFKTLK